MRGEANHRLLAVGSAGAFAGEARTAPRFALVDLGPYPGMISGGRNSVAGELYQLTAAILAGLDEFEGHPAYFRRSSIGLADGQAADAYLLAPAAARGRPRFPPVPGGGKDGGDSVGRIVRWRSG
jgi:gamma-glutamylaminecyclotransferase